MPRTGSSTRERMLDAAYTVMRTRGLARAAVRGLLPRGS
ncbi:MAG: hypothetical protein AVDCRST_MAG54-1201 [uncultured Actinomycetospora sp.]|uniref:Uncharacterized protein n=1 Tax=uncultured Actinomycetospora sp. TaxID=1135996 RepID=A0A6J4HVN7_9PSEU|nr:MAG: hypothetical protein AVDCRST_MAG54-1201 [uncultured Actinomycetospora sp.]